MATFKPLLQIKMILDSGGVVKGAAAVSRSLAGVNKAAGQTQNKASSLGKTLGSMWRITGGILLFNVIRKVTRALEGLVKVGLDFEEQMANVNSVLQVDSKTLQGFTDKVVDLALDPHVKDGPAKLAEGLYFIVSAGYNAADSMMILKQASYAASAGLTTTAVATDVIIGTLGAYNLTAKDAEKITNQLFQIVNISKYTFSDLAGAMGTVTPTASALGISLDEVGAAMATFGFRGKDANTATVEFNQILTGLLKPTTAMSDQLSAFGYESGAAMIKALGFTKTLEMFGAVIGDDKQKAADLFGNVRALRGIFTLTNDGGVKYNEMLGDMSGAQEGAGATMKALQEQMKSNAFQIDILKKNIQILAVLGFGMLAPYLNKALSTVNILISGFLTSFRHFRNKGYGFFESLRAGVKTVVGNIFGPHAGYLAALWVDKLLKLFNRIKHIVEIVGPPFMKLMIFLVHHFDTMIPIILGVVAGMKIFGAVMAINNAILAITEFELAPITLIMLAIIAVTVLLAVAWSKNWFDIQGKTKSAVKVIGAILLALWIFIQPVIRIIKLLGEYFHDVMTNKIQPGNLAKLPGWLQPIAAVLGRVIKMVRVFFKTWENKGFIAALRTIPKELRALGNAVGNMFEAMGLKRYGELFKRTFKDFSHLLSNLVSFVNDLIHGRWKKAWNDLVHIAVDMFHLFIDQISVLPTLIVDIFNMIPWGTIGSALKDAGAFLIRQLWHGLKYLFGFIEDHITGWLDDIVHAIRWYAHDVKAAGVLIIKSLWHGVKSLFTYIEDHISSWVQGLVDIIGGAWNTFFNIGNYVIGGLWSGISFAWNWMVDQLKTAWNDLPGFLKKLWDMASPSKVFAKIGHNAMVGLQMGFEKGGKLAARSLQDVTSNMTGSTIRVIGGASKSSGRIPSSSPTSLNGGRDGSRSTITLGERSIVVELKEASRAEANRAARFILQEVRRLEAAG